MTKATAKTSGKKSKGQDSVNTLGRTDAAHQQGVRNQESKFAQLVNHSYLTEEGFDVVAESLQRNLATTISLYLKLKKFHWDIRGRHFRDLHLAYDDFIDKIFPGIDEQAERLVMLGGSPIAAPSDIARYSVVQVPTETIHDAREQLTALEPKTLQSILASSSIAWSIQRTSSMTCRMPLYRSAVAGSSAASTALLSSR